MSTAKLSSLAAGGGRTSTSTAARAGNAAGGANPHSAPAAFRPRQPTGPAGAHLLSARSVSVMSPATELHRASKGRLAAGRVFASGRAGDFSASETAATATVAGRVYLAGTGPGDPELLTLKAYKLLQSVDVVLYDRLVSDDILDMIHPGAIMVYVGKESGYHTRTQEEIHELLRVYASEGQSVLRLKGGDPFIFGRGGEEQLYLQSRGISVEVVPGITAAAGICAQLGIPLTHRGVATSVRYVTGHTREGAEDELRATLAACSDPMTTMVFYMGLQTLPQLRRMLLEAGVDADLPAVAVERGTTPEQREVWAPLSSFVERVEEEGLRSPTLLVMGQVVALSQGWEASQSVPACHNLSNETESAGEPCGCP